MPIANYTLIPAQECFIRTCNAVQCMHLVCENVGEATPNSKYNEHTQFALDRTGEVSFYRNIIKRKAHR